MEELKTMDMKNEITFTQTSAKDKDKTSVFYQTDESFKFIVNDSFCIKIDKKGNCFKNGELITKDSELFEGLKVWLNHFMKLLNEGK